MSWKQTFRTRHPRRLLSRRKKTSLLYRFALFSFFGVIGLFLLSFIVFPLFALDLPSPDKIIRREGFSTKIYDRSGVLLYDIFSNQRRTAIKFDETPLYLRQATIAVEDKNFYKHSGFDPTGIIRAAFNTVIYRKLQGGSTLTQQLVKNVLLSSERTLTRKIREFILAVQIERKYTKDEILQMYLNEAPYGGTAWGVEAAAETYFGKSSKDLTLVEAAVLAGLPQRPSSYSPYGTNPQAYIGRTEHVLRRMREDGYINKEQEEEAVKQIEEIKFAEKGSTLKAPHFVIYVKSLLEERYGEALVEQGGLKVTTTLDWEVQQKAQNAVSEEIEKVEGLNITNGAAVVLNPETGEILAMVGSKNFAAVDYDGQVNVALSLRQPGSAIKPVTYVTALKKGYTASRLLMDTPTEFPGGVDKPPYKPENYDGKFRGPMQVRFALANSINAAAVKMLSQVGVREMLKTAFDLGITSLEPTKENLQRLGLSVTLGGGEVRLLDLTSAYQAFANGGEEHDPVSILKIEDSKGKVLEEFKPSSEGRRVLSKGEAFIISDILSDNEARAEVFGTRSALVVSGRKVAAKTGTTNDRRDNWTLGWTPQIVVGVWVGNNDNSPMKQLASGISGAAPIWRRIITAALEGKPNLTFQVPEDVVTAEVDKISGYRSHDGFPSRIEYFIKGTEPQGEDSVHTKLKLCKGEGKLATPSQIANNDYEEKEFFVFKEEDPFAPAGEENKWQKGIEEWLTTQTDPRYHPPIDYCGSGNPVYIDFLTPKDKERINSNNFRLKIDARSTKPIDQVTIELDGISRGTLTSTPFELNLTAVTDGPHKLRALARDKDGRESDKTINIGVNSSWEILPSPSPSPSPIP